MTVTGVVSGGVECRIVSGVRTVSREVRMSVSEAVKLVDGLIVVRRHPKFRIRVNVKRGRFFARRGFADWTRRGGRPVPPAVLHLGLDVDWAEYDG